MGWIEDQLNGDGVLTAKMLYDKFGFNHVMGIHFYGKKCIAGPICVTAVVLKPNYKFTLKPADKIGKNECNTLNDQIRLKAETVNIAWITLEAIDSLGIHDATMMAINTVLGGASAFDPLSLVFIDGFKMHPIPNGLRDSHTPIYVVTKGKDKVDSIMAASVVGRIARETMMGFFHKEYPEYDWINNGGFPTPNHIELIKQHGISPMHRDLSNIKTLQDFKAFPNKRWRKEHEDFRFGE